MYIISGTSCFHWIRSSDVTQFSPASVRYTSSSHCCYYLKRTGRLWYLLVEYPVDWSSWKTDVLPGLLLHAGLNYSPICLFCARQPPSPPHYWARDLSFLRFLVHTQRRIKVGKTPLDEWSACRRGLYTRHSQQTDIHAPGGIRTHNLGRRAAADLRLIRPRGHRDRLICILEKVKRKWLSKVKWCKLEQNKADSVRIT